MSGRENDGHYEVYWPRSPRQVRTKPLAPRLKSFDGKTIAFVWNYLYRGEEIFAWMEKELKSRFKDMKFVSWKEFGSTHGHDEREVVAALPARFKELGVDAAIAAVGA
ncbi:MAG: hypothetical protein HY525_02560 [Betaproteobacteria bacterium]|nr:hypothetical protein [Betaproteobacteria bacterium]